MSMKAPSKIKIKDKTFILIDTKIKLLRCKNCPYETKNKSSMKRHHLDIHADKSEKKEKMLHYCSTCDKGFLSHKKQLIHNETKKHKHYVSEI